MSLTTTKSKTSSTSELIERLCRTAFDGEPKHDLDEARLFDRALLHVQRVFGWRARHHGEAEAKRLALVAGIDYLLEA